MTCIFCGGTPLTGEHLWPRWFSKIVPKVATHHHGVRIRQALIAHDTVAIGADPEFLKRRPGDPASRIYRIVCKSCNEGWMGRVETAAIPVMTALIKGEQVSVQVHGQRTVAVWATLKTIIAEFDDPATQVIPNSTHKWFFENKRPPNSDWRIWIGHYQGRRWRTRYRHIGAGFVIPARPPVFPRIVADPPKLGYGQASTFVGGNLLIHVVSASAPVLTNFDLPDRLLARIFRIWPPRTDALCWPSAAISDADADAIADCFWQHLRRKRAKDAPVEIL
jgi:hypothetical protein